MIGTVTSGGIVSGCGYAMEPGYAIVPVPSGGIIGGKIFIGPGTDVFCVGLDTEGEPPDPVPGTVELGSSTLAWIPMEVGRPNTGALYPFV